MVLNSDSQQQSAKVGSPLGIIRNPSKDVSIRAGETFVLSVTVRNEGNQDAIIELSIDETSNPMRQWCLSPHTSLALMPQQSREIVFSFQIPPETLPHSYYYSLKVDSPKHYREALPIFFPGQLQVLPLLQQTRQVDDPLFVLSPSTPADRPLSLQPGETVIFAAIVENRSQRVDRFRLSCPDLAEDWVQITYPESFTTIGVSMAGEVLELNPGQNGQIQVSITPPLQTWAGIYPLTVRLSSTNVPGLVLLDLIHLKVREIYQIDLEFITLIAKVQKRLAEYELRIRNRGNTPRELAVKVIDLEEKPLCHYYLDRQLVKIMPYSEQTVTLEAEPPGAWRQTFTSQVFNFWLEIEDKQQLPLLNQRFQGALSWEARPWWHLLLLILVLVGLLGAVCLLIWWLLRPRPVSQPQIVQFTPQQTVYQEVDNQPIHLNWQITHPQNLSAVQLVGLASDGKLLSAPINYDFSQGVPDPLKTACTLSSTLTCFNVPTDAYKPGNYRFQITALVSDQPEFKPVSAQTNPIEIVPIPQPQILKFASSRPTYLSKDKGGIQLGWKINRINQIQTLKLTLLSPDAKPKVTTISQYDFSRTIGIPNRLKSFCTINQNQLTCYQVPTNIQTVGTYIVALTLIPKHQPQLSPVTEQTQPIAIAPQPIPLQIVAFNLDGQVPQPITRINLQQKRYLVLSWLVKGERSLQVQLQPAPGTINPQGSLLYPLSPQPKTETITLQASDRSGNSQTRSVVIETFLPPSPVVKSPLGVVLETPRQTETVPTLSQSEKIPSVKPTSLEQEIKPESLSPAELPPQFR